MDTIVKMTKEYKVNQPRFDSKLINPANHRMYNNESIYFATLNEKNCSEFRSKGCCTTLYSRLNASKGTTRDCVMSKATDSYDATHIAMRATIKSMPSLFSDWDFVQEYFDFVNNIFPFDNERVKLEIISIDGKMNPNASQVYLNHEKYLCLKGMAFFGYKHYINNGPDAVKHVTHTKFNLMQLSFIRHLHFGAYFSYVYHIVMLRRKPELKDLNNLQILAIAAWGPSVVTTSLYSHKFLYNYKACINADCFAGSMRNDPKEVWDKMMNGTSLNRSFTGNMLPYDPRYLQDLFVQERYLDIYKLLNRNYKIIQRGSGTYFQYRKGFYKYMGLQSSSKKGYYMPITKIRQIPGT